MGILGSLLGLINPLAAITREVSAAYTARQLAETDAQKIQAEERISWAKERADVQIAAMQHDAWFSPRNLISYAVAVYVLKLFVWDTVLGLGVTINPGDIVNWIAAEVIAALFISKTAQNVAERFSSLVGRR